MTSLLNGRCDFTKKIKYKYAESERKILKLTVCISTFQVQIFQTIKITVLFSN